MNQLDVRQVGQHVVILGWLHIIGSAILLAIAVFLFVLLTGIGVVSGDAEAVGVLGIVATSLGAFLAVLALPGVLAGVGLLMQKNWGRILAIVVGILHLVNFPIGTVIGGYTLWVLLQNAATDYFAPEPLALHSAEGQPMPQSQAH